VIVAKDCVSSSIPTGLHGCGLRSPTLTQVKEIFNWYIQEDGLLCGDLCLVNMRQDEYRIEKNTYKDAKYIEKMDKKYKIKNPSKFRFHLFVKLQVITIEDKTATVIYEKREQHILLQNMDGFFYNNDLRKKAIHERIYKLVVK
jgi:glycine cleavage system aminomethyltransferase T